MIRRILAVLGIDHATYYCIICAWWFPAGHSH